MIRNIKLTIEYDGTRLHGWQIQNKNQRTVQGEIEKALRRICKEKIRLIGSGRTDRGVHALGQVANFKTKSAKPLNVLTNALNANLPEDICILDSEETPENFHAQFSAKSKTYRYTILNREGRGALQRFLCWHYNQKLNLKFMKQEANELLGRKDFKSFQSTDPTKAKRHKKEHTIRTIKRIRIFKKDDYLIIEIEANGFLYKMVRNIVGTLLDIGRGKLPKGSMRKILSRKNRYFAGPTAKAKGLTLLRVTYSLSFH